MSWQAQAACLDEDPELFFPDGETPRYAPQIRAAVRVCTSCEVREDCLDFALSTGQGLGIWGGLTTTERKALIATGPAQRQARGA